MGVPLSRDCAPFGLVAICLGVQGYQFGCRLGGVALEQDFPGLEAGENGIEDRHQGDEEASMRTWTSCGGRMVHDSAVSRVSYGTFENY